MSKGATSEATMSVPQYQEDMGRAAADLARKIEQLGYTPYYGPDVAAFSPQQAAAFQNTNDMASAFGMQGGAVNMPQAQDFNGIQGYSSAPMFEAARAELQRRSPEQYAALMPGITMPEPEPVSQAGKGTKGGTNARPTITGQDGRVYAHQPHSGSWWADR